MDQHPLSPTIIGAPGSYIQGRGQLDRLGEYAALLGQRPLVLADRLIWPLFSQRVESGLARSSLQPVVKLFQGECTRAEIDRVTRVARDHACDAVLALGGGKTLDTAKGVSIRTGCRLLIAPTIASTDAPTSRLVVIYHQDGSWSEVEQMDRNPDMVVVDTQVIAQAPSRFLVAGMGDALPTRFEAEQCHGGRDNLNFLGGRQTRAAMALAETTYRLVRAHGPAARLAVENNLVTEAVEAVVEANVLLSGLGFESGGLSAAHALTGGFSAVPELHASLHGEQAAFGLLVQFVLENREQDFVADMLDFYLELGLPVCLADMGLPQPNDDQFRVMARESCYQGSRIFEMDRQVNEALLEDAIRAAHAQGLDHRRRNRLLG